MRDPDQTALPKILILATTSCAYPGADATGQAHLSYPTNTYIVNVPSPAVFPEQFYFDCFERGIGGIIVMSCGVECPYEGAYEQLAARLDRVSLGLRERGINQGRLKLCSICTVCTKSFVRAVSEMNEILAAEPVATAAQEVAS
jgi:coenzyme F420-reducing hydrogenase delta subunit